MKKATIDMTEWRKFVKAGLEEFRGSKTPYSRGSRLTIYAFDDAVKKLATGHVYGPNGWEKPIDPSQ